MTTVGPVVASPLGAPLGAAGSCLVSILQEVIKQHLVMGCIHQHLECSDNNMDLGVDHGFLQWVAAYSDEECVICSDYLHEHGFIEEVSLGLQEEAAADRSWWGWGWEYSYNSTFNPVSTGEFIDRDRELAHWGHLHSSCRCHQDTHDDTSGIYGDTIFIYHRLCPNNIEDGGDIASFLRLSPEKSIYGTIVGYTVCDEW